MECTKWIPKLQVIIGNHTITGNFYVVNVDDKNVVLGFQWLYSIGENITKYQIPEMRFKNSEAPTHLVERNAHLPSPSGVFSQYEVYLEAWGY